MYLWDVDLPPGRLTDNGLKIQVGKCFAQNMHLDVYGVIFTPFFCKLGIYTGNELLQNDSTYVGSLRLTH